MPIVSRELFPSTEATSVDFQAKAARVREFLFDSANPDAVRDDPACPKPGTAVHPVSVNLKCDSVETRPNGNGGTLVTAYYSNDRRFGGGRTPDRERARNKFDLGWSARDVAIRIPFSLRNKIETPNSTGTGTVIKSVWELAHFTVEETRVQRPISILIPAHTNYASLDNIAYQNKRLHTFAGRKWQFLPDLQGVRRIDEATYECKYLWELDKGTPYPTEGAGDGIRFLIATDINIQGDDGRFLIRKPYGVLSAIPPDDPEFQPFTAKNLSPYIDDPLGWRTLPGVPQDL